WTGGAEAATDESSGGASPQRGRRTRGEGMSLPVDPREQCRKPMTEAVPMTARAAVVNRTHRVVRGQAMEMREQRERSRSLWVPLGVCSILMLVLCYAVWSMLDGYDLTPSGIPD